MAEAGTGSAGASAIPANVDIYADRATRLGVRLTGLTAVNGRGFSLSFGAPTPATLADLTNVFGIEPLCESTFTGRVVIGTGYDVELTNIVVTAGAIVGASSGDHLYACVWPTLTPISSTAPSVLVDLGEIY